MAKSKGKKQRLTPSQQRYEKEIANLKKRIKRAEKAGFVFAEDIIPKTRPSRVTKGVIAELKSIRQEKLYEKATSFVTQEKPIPISQGIELVKQRRKEISIRNLPNRYKVNDGDEIYQKGKRLLLTYNDLSESGKIRFIRDLSNEDYEAFQYAKSILGDGDENVRQTDLGTGRQTGKPVLQDERTQYAEDEEGTDEEDYSEPERSVTPSAEELERKKANEEITDQKVKQWKENYERQKKLKKKDREYIYDGDAIYAGILSRIEQFESDYNANPERFKRGANKQWCVSFKHMLNNEIRIEGFNNVMRRLDGHGIEIDTALEVLLYDSNENKVSAAMSQLAEIIKGRKLTQQESQEITAISEAFNYDEADEALERFQIDELT